MVNSMNIFNSLTRNVKNIFVGSHRGDDFKLEPLVKQSDQEWFNTPHPHDSMPIANGSNRYAPPEKLAELELEVKVMAEENPRPEEDAATWFGTNDKVEKKKEDTIHEKMYEIATAKYNPFSIGGSENIHDFDSPGGSENVQKL